MISTYLPFVWRRLRRTGPVFTLLVLAVSVLMFWFVRTELLRCRTLNREMLDRYLDVLEHHGGRAGP